MAKYLDVKIQKGNNEKAVKVSLCDNYIAVNQAVYGTMSKKYVLDLVQRFIPDSPDRVMILFNEKVIASVIPTVQITEETAKIVSRYHAHQVDVVVKESIYVDDKCVFHDGKAGDNGMSIGDILRDIVAEFFDA